MFENRDDEGATLKGLQLRNVAEQVVYSATKGPMRIFIEPFAVALRL
jgi:hypothetical protein